MTWAVVGVVLALSVVIAAQNGFREHRACTGRGITDEPPFRALCAALREGALARVTDLRRNLRGRCLLVAAPVAPVIGVFSCPKQRVEKMSKKRRQRVDNVCSGSILRHGKKRNNPSREERDDERESRVG